MPRPLPLGTQCGVPRAAQRIARASPRWGQGQPGECGAVRGGSRSRRRRIRAGGRRGRGARGHGLRPRDAGSESRPGASHASRPTWPGVLHQAVGGTARGARRRGAVSADRGALRLGMGNCARLRHGDFGGTGHSAVARTVGRRPQPRAPCPDRRPRAVRSSRLHDSAPAPDRAGGVQLRCNAIVAVRILRHVPGRAHRTGSGDRGAAVLGDAGGRLRRPGGVG